MAQRRFQFWVGSILFYQFINAQGLSNDFPMRKVAATLHFFANKSLLVLGERNSHPERLRQAILNVKNLSFVTFGKKGKIRLAPRAARRLYFTTKFYG